MTDTPMTLFEADDHLGDPVLRGLFRVLREHDIHDGKYTTEDGTSTLTWSTKVDRCGRGHPQIESNVRRAPGRKPRCKLCERDHLREVQRCQRRRICDQKLAELDRDRDDG